MSQNSPPEDSNPKSTNNLFDLAQGSDWQVSLTNENQQDRDYPIQQNSCDVQHRRGNAIAN